MKRFIRLLWVMFLAGIANIGCAGMETMPGKARGMAWVEINNTTTENIAAAAKKVFIKNGYDVVKQEPNVIVFEKPGSRLDDISYGGPLNEEGVWVKVVLEMNSKGNSTHWVSCDAYMIKNKDDEFFRQETKVLKLFGREYQQLLNQIKKEVSH